MAYTRGFRLCHFGPLAGAVDLDAAVEQRRREDAKAENKERLAFSPVPADVTWQVNPNHP
jgi:hypothetical protein